MDYKKKWFGRSAFTTIKPIAEDKKCGQLQTLSMLLSKGEILLIPFKEYFSNVSSIFCKSIETYFILITYLIFVATQIYCLVKITLKRFSCYS